MDAITAEHEAMNLLTLHYEQFYDCCISVAAYRESNKDARQQLIDEMMGEVCDRLPRICERYDETKGTTLIQWSMVNIKWYLLKFNQYLRIELRDDIPETIEDDSESIETRIGIADEVWLLRSELSTVEWDLLYHRYALGYNLEQVAHKFNYSVSHIANKIERIKLHLRATHRNRTDNRKG